MQQELGDKITHDDIRDYLWKTLKSGQVVPGYAHSLSALFLSTHGKVDMDMVFSETPILDSLLCKSSARRDLSSRRAPSCSW
jgi:hypothetical protein